MTDDVGRFRRAYPQIWFACHVRHRGRGEAGLTDREASILSHLAVADAASLAVLARHLGLAPSTLSEALKRLESSGWIRVAPDHGDRRRRGVTVTEQGRRALNGASGLDGGRVAALLDRLGAAERKRALDGLDALAVAARNLRSAADPAEDD